MTGLLLLALLAAPAAATPTVDLANLDAPITSCFQVCVSKRESFATAVCWQATVTVDGGCAALVDVAQVPVLIGGQPVYGRCDCLVRFAVRFLVGNQVLVRETWRRGIEGTALVVLRTSLLPPPPSTAIFTDGFETGDLSRWGLIRF